MELTIVKKVIAENARIHILFDPENPQTVMYLEYTCPKCAGRGCNNHQHNNEECNSGSFKKKLDPAHLDQTFSATQLLQIKAAIQNLYLEVIGD